MRLMGSVSGLPLRPSADNFRSRLINFRLLQQHLPRADMPSRNRFCPDGSVMLDGVISSTRGILLLTPARV
jgi:hypothetical protein